MSDEPRTAPASASIGPSWWPGWIWSVPLAALGIGIWLLVRLLVEGGTDITITFTDANGVKAKDTSVEYRGTEVGSVTAVTLSKDGTTVKVRANIQGRAQKLLRTGTIFWLRGATPSLSDLSSLSAVLSGPTIEMEPGPGEKAKHFDGRQRKPAVMHHGAPVLFAVSFPGSTGELTPGDPVKLRGFTVGEVQQIGFHYDPASGDFATPVTLALYPDLIPAGAPSPLPAVTAFESVVDDLVSHGLRAKLDRDPPLIGDYHVTLEMVPGAPPASLNIIASLPAIPVAPGGDGLESIVTRVKDVPIEQIAHNVLDITHHVDEIVAAPQLKDSVTQLNASLRAIHETVKTIAPQVTQVVERLRATAEQLDHTAAAADQTLSGATSQTGVQTTLREIKEAAVAVRSLADYLDRHPEALISGRGQQ